MNISSFNFSKLVSTGLPSMLLASSAIFIGYNLLQRKRLNDNIAKNIYIDPIISTLVDYFRELQEKQQQQQQKEEDSSNNNNNGNDNIDFIIVHDNEISTETIDEVAQKLYKTFTSHENRYTLNQYQKQVNVFCISRDEFVYYNQYNANRTSVTAIINIESAYPTSIKTQLSLCAKTAKLLLLNHPYITLLNHKITIDSNNNKKQQQQHNHSHNNNEHQHHHDDDNNNNEKNEDEEIPLTASELETIYNLSGFSNVKITQFVNGNPITLITSTSPSWRVGESEPIKLN